MTERMIAKDTYKVKVGKIRRLDFLLFCIAPFFIFNPEIALMDILPDAIGYVLMLIPLMKLRDVNERFDDAKKHIWIALAINIGKYAALMLSFGALSQKEGGSASSIMMFSLIFAVLDILFVMMAFRTFFDAVQKLGDKYECSAIIGRKEIVRKGVRYVSKKNRTEKIAASTIKFVIVRALCYAIPEFSTGSAHAYDDTAFDWYKFTALFRMIGIMIALVVGLVWLVKMTVYFARIFRDKEFVKAVNADYKENAQSLKIKFILRKTALFATAASIAIFLCGDIYVYGDRINILSDTLAAIVMLVMLVGVYSMYKTSAKMKLVLLVPSCVWLVSSLAKDVIRYIYFDKFTINLYVRDPDAYSLYTTFSVVSVIDAVVYCAVVLSVCAMINYINNEYAVSKLSIENESILKMKDTERREFSKSYVLPAKIFAFLAAACSAAYPFMLAMTTMKIPNTGDKYQSAEYMLVSFGSMYWFLDLAASLVLAILVRRALSALVERSENNLMLE